MLGSFDSAGAARTHVGQVPAASATRPTNPSVVSNRFGLLSSSTVLCVESFHVRVVLFLLSFQKSNVTSRMTNSSSEKTVSSNGKRGTADARTSRVTSLIPNGTTRISRTVA